eukprot:356856-Chlamydomonas_euryale.AAC.3
MCGGNTNGHIWLIYYMRRYPQKHLGCGSLGCVGVYNVVGCDEVLAIKCLPIEAVDKHVERQVLTHVMLRHPHIIEFKVRAGHSGVGRQGVGRGKGEGVKGLGRETEPRIIQ